MVALHIPQCRSYPTLQNHPQRHIPLHPEAIELLVTFRKKQYAGEIFTKYESHCCNKYLHHEPNVTVAVRKIQMHKRLQPNKNAIKRLRCMD